MKQRGFLEFELGLHYWNCSCKCYQNSFRNLQNANKLCQCLCICICCNNSNTISTTATTTTAESFFAASIFVCVECYFESPVVGDVDPIKQLDKLFLYFFVQNKNCIDESSEYKTNNKQTYFLHLQCTVKIQFLSLSVCSVFRICKHYIFVFGMWPLISFRTNSVNLFETLQRKFFSFDCQMNWSKKFQFRKNLRDT